MNARWGVIKTTATDDLDARLRMLRDGAASVAALAGEFEAAMETPFVGKNAQTAIKLGQAQAALALGVCEVKPMIIARYSPATIKKTVTGNGQATKIAVRATVVQLLGLNAGPSSLDASDALAVAYTHYLRTCAPSVW